MRSMTTWSQPNLHCVSSKREWRSGLCGPEHGVAKAGEPTTLRFHQSRKGEKAERLHVVGFDTPV
jgi:hypothetical protein